MYLCLNAVNAVPSELDSELLFFSSSSTGANSSELVETNQRIHAFYTRRYKEVSHIIYCRCSTGEKNVFQQHHDQYSGGEILDLLWLFHSW